MAGKDNRSAQVHLRLTADEAARMRARAEASGLGLSAYIRGAEGAGDAAVASALGALERACDAATDAMRAARP